MAKTPKVYYKAVLLGVGKHRHREKLLPELSDAKGYLRTHLADRQPGWIIRVGGARPASLAGQYEVLHGELMVRNRKTSSLRRVVY